MKKQNTVTITSLLVLTLVFAMAISVNAQDKERSTKVTIEKYNLSANSVKSLIIGIKSENPGLRNSAIFYAGQYKLKEAVQCLIEQLKKEEDPGTKILIAMSLYKIGNPIAIEYIRDIVNAETNLKVKHMFSEILNEFTINNSIATVAK